MQKVEIENNEQQEHALLSVSLYLSLVSSLTLLSWLEMRIENHDKTQTQICMLINWITLLFKTQ